MIMNVTLLGVLEETKKSSLLEEKQLAVIVLSSPTKFAFQGVSKIGKILKVNEKKEKNWFANKVRSKVSFVFTHLLFLSFVLHKGFLT